MTLSEFDRMCRGYHRRETERWRRTREVVAALYNVNRGPKEPPVTGPDIWSLPGDPVRPAQRVLTAEELEAELAAAADLDPDW